MPRYLTSKQKKYIDGLISQGVTDIDEISHWDYETIEEMNDFETIYQCIDMYIWDKRMSGACDRTLKSNTTL